MSEQVFVGTWEQLSVHASRFHGQMLKLTVVSDSIRVQEPSAVSEVELHSRLAALVQEAESLDLTPGERSADPNKNIISEVVADKYRKMGFQL